jgi:hypothetical protein
MDDEVAYGVTDRTVNSCAPSHSVAYAGRASGPHTCSDAAVKRIRRVVVAAVKAIAKTVVAVVTFVFEWLDELF